MQVGNLARQDEDVEGTMPNLGKEFVCELAVEIDEVMSNNFFSKIHYCPVNSRINSIAEPVKFMNR